ncbi:MAG TPA: tyrosine-type recombinase/integrase, partial [Polyangiaceae bacterium]
MACTSIPLEHRVLWGFLVREGMRESEAVGTTIGDIDVKRAAIKLDKNKTDDPRAWALNQGVARALELFIAEKRADAETSERSSSTRKG